MRLLMTLALLPVLAACAGRFPDPIEERQAADFDLSCTTLSAEIEGYRDKAQYTAKMLNEKISRNWTVGAIAIATVQPAFLALDLSDAEKQEIAALEARARHLEDIQTAKGCHLHAEVPEGFATYSRRRHGFFDSHGRRLSLPLNHYVYGPGGNIGAAATAQRSRNGS